MKITLSNGCIVNTCASIVLFTSSYLSYTVSCTYILTSSLALVRKRDKGKTFNKFKAAKAVLFAVFIIILSATASVMTSWLLLNLDYNGPNSGVNN